MLASALDSHPDIQCEGEYGMIEKFPLGRTEKAVKGCIIQAYHIQRSIAPGWVKNVKVIYLERPLPEICESLFRGSPTGQNFSQHLEPAEPKKPCQPDKNTFEQLQNLRQHVRGFLDTLDHYHTVTYRQLCGDKDSRAIRWEAAQPICDFLDVSREPLIPKTHKPTENRNRETVRDLPPAF